MEKFGPDAIDWRGGGRVPGIATEPAAEGNTGRFDWIGCWGGGPLKRAGPTGQRDQCLRITRDGWDLQKSKGRALVQSTGVAGSQGLQDAKG